MRSSPPATPAPEQPGADLARAWRLERRLALARLPNVPLCLLLLPLVPGVSRPGTLLLAGLLAVGDLGALALLRRAPATATEWRGALGVIALCAPFPTVPVPALLPLALALTADRHGPWSLLGGTALAGLAFLALAGAQAGPLGVRDVAAALGLGAFLGAARWAGRAAAVPCPAAEPAGGALPAARSPLSPRERQVLALLAREADGELGSSRNTVKTYMAHLARKRGAADTSRPALLQVARRLGELPPGPLAGQPLPRAGAMPGVSGQRR